MEPEGPSIVERLVYLRSVLHRVAADSEDARRWLALETLSDALGTEFYEQEIGSQAFPGPIETNARITFQFATAGRFICSRLIVDPLSTDLLLTVQHGYEIVLGVSGIRANLAVRAFPFLLATPQKVIAIQTHYYGALPLPSLRVAIMGVPFASR